jgi:hypothetical protein
VSALRTVDIEEAQLAWFASESLNRAVEHADCLPLDRENPPGDAARLAPKLDPESTRPDLKRVLPRCKGRDFLAQLNHRGTATATQKCFNRCEQSVRLE